MSISRVSGSRWRVQIYDKTTGRQKQVGYAATKGEAKRMREDARARAGATKAPTVREFWLRWTTDPLFQRPKRSTDIQNHDRTRPFVEAHGDLPMNHVTDQVVIDWIDSGRRRNQVSSLRTMWNDAISARGGRLITVNPWAKLGLSKGTGNRYNDPPPEETVWALIETARRICSPYLAAWFQVAAFTGMRPGELDALRWSSVDFGRGLIRVSEQWSSVSGAFTAPKNGRSRDVPMTPPAHEALVALPRVGEFVFVNLHNNHWTDGGRKHYWQRMRDAAGYTGTVYLATRHFAGSYMVNVLGLDSEDVAIALGHTDGGELVRRLYGHRDTAQALQRVAEAYARVGNVKPLRVVEDTG